MSEDRVFTLMSSMDKRQLAQRVADLESQRSERPDPVFVPTMIVTPELIDEITEQVTERIANSMRTAVKRERWEFNRAAMGGD